SRCQYLFVNGRWVRDRSLAHALQEAYRGLLMTGRYAVSFLLLEVPPDQVDVNVHPTKAEVRFRDGHALYHLVFAAVRGGLRAANLTPRLQVPATPPTTTEAPWSLIARLPSAANLPFTAAVPPHPPTPPLPQGGERGARQAEAPFPPAAFSPPPPVGEGPGVGGPAPGLPPDSFKAIQLYDAYLVVETAEGMLWIDQ